MIKINANFYLHLTDLQFTFIASPGPGGQHVNKVATAALLRFNLIEANLTTDIRAHLLMTLANRLTKHSELVIKSSRFRSQEQNKQDAIARLIVILKKASMPVKKRKKTRPTRASIEKRLTNKKAQGLKKERRQSKLD